MPAFKRMPVSYASTQWAGVLQASGEETEGRSHAVKA